MINKIILIKNNFQNADLHHRVPGWTSDELEEWDEGKEGRHKKEEIMYYGCMPENDTAL